MAKITLVDISSGYLSLATYNANNTLIETALENTLSRDGTSPNTMSANLDLNSNKVVNILDGTNNQDAVSLSQLTAATVVASSTTAALVSLADAGGSYTSTTAEAAFAELAATTGAGIIGVLDTGGYFAGTDVETILADIGANYVKASGNVTFSGLFYISERAAAGADVATAGQFYVKNTSPNEPWFRDGDGTGGRLLTSVHDQGEAVLDNVVLKDFGIKHSTPTSASGVLTLDLTTSRSFKVDLTENITSVVIQNPNSTDIWCAFTVTFVQDGTGSRTVAGWPASVKWPSGAAPTITTTATTGTDILSFKTFDNGTTYYGNVSQDYS